MDPLRTVGRDVAELWRAAVRRLRCASLAFFAPGSFAASRAQSDLGAAFSERSSFARFLTTFFPSAPSHPATDRRLHLASVRIVFLEQQPLRAGVPAFPERTSAIRPSILSPNSRSGCGHPSLRFGS
jgi:hypothetical protein